MRPSFASIDLAALQHNYQLARQLARGYSLAVVKADAYGHGAVACARALAAVADGFAVSCLQEALQLRAAGIDGPIVLLEGFFTADELKLCYRHRLWPVIHAHWQIELLEQQAQEQQLVCWIKLDSGMHRVGFFPAEIGAACQRLRACAGIDLQVLMTHLARADEGPNPAASQQIDCARNMAQQQRLALSLSNSAAVLGWPQLHATWSRPGIMLYGANPMLRPHELVASLRPVMSLQSQVIALRELPAGEAVGYGGRFVTRTRSRVAIVAIGYADGYPRHAVDGTPVLVDGQRARLAGRVSMDMLAVDVTEVPQAKVGSKVELWGKQLAADEVAQHADTISYCLFTAVRRVPLLYDQ